MTYTEQASAWNVLIEKPRRRCLGTPTHHAEFGPDRPGEILTSVDVIANSEPHQDREQAIDRDCGKQKPAQDDTIVRANGGANIAPFGSAPAMPRVKRSLAGPRSDRRLRGAIPIRGVHINGAHDDPVVFDIPPTPGRATPALLLVGLADTPDNRLG